MAERTTAGDGAASLATAMSVEVVTHDGNRAITDRTVMAGADAATPAQTFGNLLAHLLPPAAHTTPAAERRPAPTRVQRRLRRLLAQDLAVRERIAAAELRQARAAKHLRLARQIRLELDAASGIKRRRGLR